MIQYYIVSNDRQAGPFPESKIREMLGAGVIAPDTLCWTDGMEDWQPIAEVIQIDTASGPPLPAVPQSVKPGYPPKADGDTSAPQYIPNYLAQAILVTLFCCMPLGIPAIIYASQVNSKAQAGDIEGAKDSSRKARVWSWWSFGVVVASFVLHLLFSAVTLVLAFITGSS